MQCLFCKIINKEIPSDIVYEDEKVISFKDIHPKAPIHFLILPKKHIPSVNHLEETDKELVGNLFLVAKNIARDKNLNGYKLIVNVGREGGQLIDHLHLHLLAGWKSPEEREIPKMP
ncbi:histidine triad nucleotide-binding protein [Patescibacteria group bacterium]|nr:histidine triad nucleotide-binding protein [Patescibacteria group bacterium]